MGGICNLSAKNGYKIFIYGSKEDVNKASVQKLLKIYPKLNIVGRSNGYVKNEEMERLINKINESKAEILFLALGSPKQEKWYMRFKNQLNTVRVVQGIGGALDVIAGNVKRAPEAWQKLGLEWLYRLISEPKRIRRQWIYPIFALMILISWLKDSTDKSRNFMSD
jgi:N-acetylglucosaminyldiphosphoundecaprenol N-acetyl-beta-D-mannosaminyltransferase